MATANLLQVGTPGPALSLGLSTTGTAPAATATTPFGAIVASAAAGTYVQAASLSLTAGTYCVTGLVCTSFVIGAVIAVVSLTTASSTPASPTIQSGSGLNAGDFYRCTSVIKVTATTTVYLNVDLTAGAGANINGLIIATKIA